MRFYPKKKIFLISDSIYEPPSLFLLPNPTYFPDLTHCLNQDRRIWRKRNGKEKKFTACFHSFGRTFQSLLMCQFSSGNVSFKRLNIERGREIELQSKIEVLCEISIIVPINCKNICLGCLCRTAPGSANKAGMFWPGHSMAISPPHLQNWNIPSFASLYLVYLHTIFHLNKQQNVNRLD